MALYTVVYVSIANQFMSDEDLLDLLEKARKHNQAYGITGMLLFRDGFFIQVLEGEEKVVNTLFGHIQKDSRHRNVLLLEQYPLSRRNFKDWAMGFETFDMDKLNNIPGFSDFMLTGKTDNFDQMSSHLNGEVKELFEIFRH